MKKLHFLPRKIIFRECPGCGWRVTQTIVSSARFNYRCRRCGQHALDEFLPIYDEGKSK